MLPTWGFYCSAGCLRSLCPALCIATSLSQLLPEVLPDPPLPLPAGYLLCTTEERLYPFGSLLYLTVNYKLTHLCNPLHLHGGLPYPPVPVKARGVLTVFPLRGASSAHVPPACLDPLLHGAFTSSSQDRALPFKENLEPYYLELVYSDMIKRAGKWRKQRSNGSQPHELIQLDMVGQKPFTIVPLAPTGPATHTFPLSWLSAIADMELE